VRSVAQAAAKNERIVMSVSLVACASYTA